MRHTRKMVMIPEAEYQTLLNLMTKTGDEMQNEKIKLDAKIATTLNDPKLEPEIKQKKYNVLYKQRRQMKEMIENKPQKVVIQNPLAVPANVAPYLGLNKIQTNAIDPEENENKNLIRRAALGSFSETERSSTAPSNREKSDSEKDIIDNGNISSTTYDSAPADYLSLKDRKKLLELIRQNPTKFAVAPNGQILSNRNLRIKESHFKDSIDFLTGARDSPPRGHKFFEYALRRDPEARKIITGQSGEGKHKRLRFARKIQIIKTPGLKRIKKHPITIFKPQLWAKL